MLLILRKPCCHALPAVAVIRTVRMQILVPTLYLAFVTAAGCFVAGLVALSTLASDELRDVLSDTLAQVGETISG